MTRTRLTLVVLVTAVLLTRTSGWPGGAVAHAQSVVPVTVLTPSDSASGDWFGSDVSIDGDYVIGGSPFDDDSGNASGSAYIFNRSAGTWAQAAKLVPTGANAADTFGYATAIDGTTAVIGANQYVLSPRTIAGRAVVFRRTGASWSQEAELFEPDAVVGDYFGSAVAVSGDTVAVGARDRDLGVRTDAGAVFVYTRTGSAWALQATLTPPVPQSTQNFGNALSLRGDLLVVGSFREDHNPSQVDRGAVYVYRRTNGAWALEARQQAPDAMDGDDLGQAVATDGATIAAGAHGRDDAGSFSGAAYVFAFNGSTWVFQQKLVPTGLHANDAFGSSIGVEGGVIAGGAPLDPTYGTQGGAVYVFRRSHGSWTQTQKLYAINPTNAGPRFGDRLSLRGTGMVVGAFHDSRPLASSGAAFVFSVPPTDTDGDGVPDTADNCPDDANAGQDDADGDEVGDVCDPCTDVDQDGYGTPGDASCSAGAAADCNDTNSAVNPGHAEVTGNGSDDDCNSSTPDCIDADGDTYSVSGGVCGPVDCNDASASVHPGQAEIQGNGVDDDCNAVTPDCVDGDGDGSSVSGGVCGPIDCNDSLASVHPGALEVCNETDDDCDGSIDDGVTLSFHRDADGDSYGNPALTVQACAAPGGYVADGSDCNDGNPAVNPGHAEVPGNGIDDDCNAATADCFDGDGDGYSPSGGSCGPVDCIDSDANVNPGHAEVAGNGVDDDCNASTPDCVDADGDGYAASGGVCGAIDCLDANASVNPGRAEVPGNNLDDDCDVGTSDCRDLDGDGYGNPASSACAQPQADCNDANADVNPGRTEIPSNGIDDDCNAATPGGCSAP